MKNYISNTSVSVQCNISAVISNFSDEYSISRSEIIRRLLKKGLKRIKSISIDNRLIEYQEEEDEKCKIMHFSVDAYLKKNLSYTRDKYRISVSKILCAAFLFFWDELIEEILGNIEDVDLSNYEEIFSNSLQIMNYFITRLGFETKRRKTEKQLE